MKFAIIETGGKQYRVEPEKILRVEKLGEMKEGEKVVFDKVLLVSDGKKTEIGAPYLAGAKVEGTFTGNGRGKKVTVIKYKQKSRYFRKKGHRQEYSEVKIAKT